MDVIEVDSLGAGVQSSTVALKQCYGELPKPDAIIFADTGWEPRAVYAHLVKLEAECKRHGIEVVRVTAGNIRDDHLNPQGEHLFIRKPRKHPEWLGRQRTFIPVYITTPTGRPAGLATTANLFDPNAVEEMGVEVVSTKKGLTRRTCTKTYKIEPVEKKIRELLGLRPYQPWPKELAVIQNFGISWDETERMTDSPRPAIEHRYPLVDLRMTRDDCHDWLEAHGWPDVPRSACIGCPFHRNDEWRNLRDNSPDEWDDAVEFDHVFRARQQAELLPMVGTPYLHEQRVPLDEAIIDPDPDAVIEEQMSFGEECSGFCGV
jgi:hypothetical protein